MSEPVSIELDIGSGELADRLIALLAPVSGLRLVQRGEPADATISAPRSETDAALTPRELEVLALLAEGASNKDIGTRLGISVHTAKFHVSSLLDKLDATGRTDAVAHAARTGVIQL